MSALPDDVVPVPGEVVPGLDDVVPVLVDVGTVLDDMLSGRDSISCGCGHDHDPDELHVTDGGCAHDGRGTDCTHNCDSCVLASLRPSPTTSRSARLAE